MDEDNIVEFPISSFKRRRNIYGDRAVECLISGRWLQFPEQGSAYLKAGEVLQINVMTNTDGDKEQKLCELTLTREDLLKAIAAVKPAKED